MKKFIPFLEWFPTYKMAHLKDDVVGGFTVGIVLIPQGIAYALIAGVPPIYGLYSALIPQLIYVLFGTAQRIAVGPVAMDSLIVAAGVSTFAVAGTEQYLTLALLLAFMVGVIQLVLGIAKLGFIVNFLSKPVISGFTSAAAIVIALNQLSYLTAIKLPPSNQFHVIIGALIQNFHQIDLPTLMIGMGTILILYLLKIIKSKIPGPLLVVVMSILVLNFFHQSLTTVAILKDIPSGLPSFYLPTFNVVMVKQLLPIAITLAIIGFLETISIGKALEKSSDPMMISSNKELIALGMMNVFGSMFKSYNATASFSRSAVNSDAGSRTVVAAFFSVLIVMLVLLFLTPYFYYLPKAVLGAIILMSVLKLIDFKEAKRLFVLYRNDFWMLITTFSGTLFWGIKEGIAVGVILSLIALIAKTSKPHIAVLGKIPGTKIFRNVDRFEEVEVDKDILIIRFDARLYFANANYFSDTLQQFVIEKKDGLQLIVIDCECVNGIDSTAIQMLENLISFYYDKGIVVYFTNIKGPVRDVLLKSTLQQYQNCKYFLNNDDAVAYYKTRNESLIGNLANYIYQTNQK